MLTRQDVHKAITKNVLGFDLGRLESDETSFFDAGLDSLDHASLLLTLEEDHGVRIPDEDAANLMDVKSILEYASGQSAG